MRRTLIALVVASLLLGRPTSGRAESQAEEFGNAVAAAGANLLYFPAKLLVAIGGGVLGGFTGFLTGGDVRAAYAVWVPSASGTYILRPANMEGSAPIEFFGTDYADRPSAFVGSVEAAGIYEMEYSR